jgi:4-hydroxy-tetrahydrodipicolinate reductase
MGVELVRACARRGDVLPVAAIVTDPAKQGRDLGDIAGLDVRLGAPASLDAEEVLARDDVDIVFYTGAGGSGDVARALSTALAFGKDVITYSGVAHPATAIGSAAAQDLDAQARAAGRRALCTGFAPGFMTDVLPIVLASCCIDWTRIDVGLVMRMDDWGPATLDAYGIGALPGAHEPSGSRISFMESVGIIADALWVDLVSAEEAWDPIVSEHDRQGRDRVIRAGHVTGVRRTYTGTTSTGREIRVQLTIVYALDEAVDGLQEEYVIDIAGGSASGAHARLSGGWSPDPYPATAASGLNAVPGLLSLPPGLYNVAQVPFTGVSPGWRSLREIIP